MAARKGRPKYRTSPIKALEKLSSDQIDQIKLFQELRSNHAVDVVTDLDAHWLAVARARLTLASVHCE